VTNTNLALGNIDPKGATANVAGNTVWVIDKNKTVYVYDGDGASLGSWTESPGRDRYLDPRQQEQAGLPLLERCRKDVRQPERHLQLRASFNGRRNIDLSGHIQQKIQGEAGIRTRRQVEGARSRQQKIAERRKR
jgi:hypothetical protein